MQPPARGRRLPARLASALDVSPETLCDGVAWDVGRQRFRIETPPAKAAGR
jgi:hypothetical protein